MWTGMEIRGRRVPESDRIPPSPPPLPQHQVSTNTRSANTKLIKFVLNLRYDTFILTQQAAAGEIGVNFESSEQQLCVAILYFALQ